MKILKTEIITTMQVFICLPFLGALLLHNTFSVKLLEAYIDIEFWRQITATVNTTNIEYKDDN